jgi:hypothetical protein
VRERAEQVGLQRLKFRRHIYLYLNIPAIAVKPGIPVR